MDRQAIVASAGEDDNSRIFKIQLTNRSITAIAPLKQYDKLRCLNLSYNLIEKIQNLQTLTDLRELHLENNAIGIICNLDVNKNLQVLNLANNRIEKIENIGHLIKLQTLILNSNCIGKLTGLEYLKDLKTLSVSKNNLDSIESLPTFSRLTTLILSHNKIKNISQNLFMSSKALTMLNLSHNKISKTLFLKHLVNLELLDLSHNFITVLQVPSMNNLQSLNISHNQIDKLPAFSVCFPELISVDISHNSICSEVEMLEALQQTQYVTEIDFRDNPMFSQNFESALQKIHCFDFLNGKPMTKAGAKYYLQVAQIQQDLQKNRQFYGLDDEKDRQLKMSGFYDEQLEFQMSGLRANRPGSPKKKRNLQKATFYDDIGRSYHQFVQNDTRIKVIREQYLKICGQYNIINSQHILTEIPLRTNSEQKKQQSLKKIPDPKPTYSQQFQAKQAEHSKLNERQASKWKELKNKQKTFKIRDVIKSRGNSSNTKVHGSSTNTNWANANSTIATPNSRTELFRTQMLPRKMQQVPKSMLRPSSMRKKD